MEFYANVDIVRKEKLQSEEVKIYHKNTTFKMLSTKYM